MKKFFLFLILSFIVNISYVEAKHKKNEEERRIEAINKSVQEAIDKIRHTRINTESKVFGIRVFAIENFINSN